MSFRIDKGQMIPIGGNKTGKARKNGELDFQHLLQETINKKQEVKISAHAHQRMAERDIKLEQKDMDIIGKAMDDLGKKGAKESLMLYKEVALIASVKNKTIITVTQSEDMDVVTNIDSAIFIK